MDKKTGNLRPRVLSGMRPTGRLHLGNYVGALQNWVKLQNTHDCFFFVADWHALTTDYDDTSRVADNTLEVVLDWLSAGLDPEKCTLFVQSHIKQHAELHVLFSMVTPLGWLERVPTYKEQQQNLKGKDLLTYGFLGYPLLQAADILIYNADFVPVGEDQVAHVELTREVARRFNQFFPGRKPPHQPVIKEPQALLTATPKLLGSDGRKMSKSYGNSILLSDDAATVEQKIRNSVTDRPKLTDRGNPDRCAVGNLHQVFSDPGRLAYITQGCTQASIKCVECKTLAIESVNAHLEPIRERRRRFSQEPQRVAEIIRDGDQRATQAAETTMVAVRDAVGLLTIAAAGVPAADSGASPLRSPESIEIARTDAERWDIRVAAWLQRVNQTHPLKKDRRALYITRKGRKVGVHAAAEKDGTWNFEFENPPVNVLVLLAEDKDRFLHPYVLPPRFLQEHWKFGGNMDAWVRKNPNGDAVLALATSNIPIQEYEDNNSALE